jgi:hypothetical protein
VAKLRLALISVRSLHDRGKTGLKGNLFIIIDFAKIGFLAIGIE